MHNQEKHMSEEEKEELKQLKKLEMQTQIKQSITKVVDIALEVAVTTAIGILVTRAMDKGEKIDTFEI